MLSRILRQGAAACNSVLSEGNLVAVRFEAVPASVRILALPLERPIGDLNRIADLCQSGVRRIIPIPPEIREDPRTHSRHSATLKKLFGYRFSSAPGLLAQGGPVAAPDAARDL
jgi:hypothetical protein